MPKPLRIALPLLLLLAVYGGSGLSAVFPNSNGAAFFIWTALVLLIGVANVANAILDRSEGAPRRLAFWSMLLKLCTIPFYLIVFIGGTAISIAMAVVPGLIFGLPIVVAILAAIDYVLLLFTSSYGIAAAARGRAGNCHRRVGNRVLRAASAVRRRRRGRHRALRQNPQGRKPFGAKRRKPDRRELLALTGSHPQCSAD